VGISGGQIEDGSIGPEKLSAEAHALFLGGIENKTLSFQIGLGDRNKVFTNIGAPVRVVGMAETGLPVGFSFATLRMEQEFLFQPEADQKLRVASVNGSRWADDGQPACLYSAFTGTKWVKTHGGWVPFPDYSKVGAFAQQHTGKDAHPSNGLILENMGVVDTAINVPVNDWQLNLVTDESTPRRLGYRSPSEYVDEAALSQAKPLCLLIENKHLEHSIRIVAGALLRVLTLNPNQDLLIRLRTARVLAPGDKERWYIDTEGRLYEGGTESQGFLSWNTALFAGPI